jgi:hypothetical protein
MMGRPPGDVSGLGTRIQRRDQEPMVAMSLGARDLSWLRFT